MEGRRRDDPRETVGRGVGSSGLFAGAFTMTHFSLFPNWRRASCKYFNSLRSPSSLEHAQGCPCVQNRRQKFVVILSFSFLVASGLEYYYDTLFWHDVDVGIDIGRSGVYFFNKWRVGLGFCCVFFVLWFIVAFLISTVYILLLGWVGR